MKSVLITGASGALGQAVNAMLVSQKNVQVVAADRSMLDVTNRTQLTAFLKKTNPDVVLHLAASFSNEFESAYQVNVEATRMLLELVSQDYRATRVLLVGSAAEYGYLQINDNPVTECRVLDPVSVYGLTKAWQTQLARLYAKQGVDVLLARVFNLYGPAISERLFVGRLQRQLEQVVAGEQSRIKLGALSAVRDYISTKQAAEQIMAIVNHGQSGEVYHVASGEPVTVHTMLRQYLDEYGLDESIVDYDQSLGSHTGNSVTAIYADISKTTKLIDLEKYVG